MVDLSAKPFHLSLDDMRWLETTLAAMTFEEKLAQLFCLTSYASDGDELVHIARNVRPGGMMCRPMNAADVVKAVGILQENSRIPMLVAANLEKGGSGVAAEGTTIGSQMQVAATRDVDMARKLGTVCGREGAALGVNWAFSPIIDIDYNFRNPITNTRTFGSDPETVRRFGVAYVEALQKEGLAASIKHFPGDGVDERDQHLVPTVNSMSCDQWDATYGAAYKACIDAGAMTVMVGHILQPAYSRRFTPGLKDRDILPATLSGGLCTRLLREQLGFNGLIVTDASTMAGMSIPMPRRKAVPQAIAAGCDMFLFTRCLEEDIGFMRQGVLDGVITPSRLEEALKRILGLKAALGLHKKQKAGGLIPDLARAKAVLCKDEHVGWAKECADKAITLVKEEAGVLPLNPKRYRRVLYYPIESEAGFAYTVRTGVVDLFKNRLINEGFEVDEFVPKPGVESRMEPYATISDNYDLIVYLANMSTKSNQTVVRIEWQQPMGANLPTYVTSVPTVFISVENPYHLLDVPRVRTYINTYGSTDVVLDLLMDKLMGRSAFVGTSPVDPFCGMWDTRL
jgi:beta-N-acetylhexosaminidase